jgi:hypothetical protein
MKSRFFPSGGTILNFFNEQCPSTWFGTKGLNPLSRLFMIDRYTIKLNPAVSQKELEKVLTEAKNVDDLRYQPRFALSQKSTDRDFNPILRLIISWFRCRYQPRAHRTRRT